MAAALAKTQQTAKAQPSGAPGQRPGFLFLSCPDTQLLLEEVEARARAWAPAGAPFKRLCFWGDEPPDNAFWEALNLRDLFGSVRLVLVRQAHLWHADVWKLLDKTLARPLTGSFPIFCLENAQEGRGKVKIPQVIDKLKCMKFATKMGWTWANAGLTDKTIRAYVARQAKDRGLQLDPMALTLLSENTPKFAGVVAAELDKLVLLAKDGRVSVDMLATADWSAEGQSFSCLNYLMQGKEAQVWSELARLGDLDDQAFMLLGLLAWNFRTLWLLMVDGYSGRPVFSVNAAMARRIGPARLANCMTCVLDAEVAIKTGTQPRQAIEITFAKLLQILK